MIQTVQHPCHQNSFNKTPSNKVLKMKEHCKFNFLWYAFQNLQMYLRDLQPHEVFVCLFVRLYSELAYTILFYFIFIHFRNELAFLQRENGFQG